MNSGAGIVSLIFDNADESPKLEDPSLGIKIDMSKISILTPPKMKFYLKAQSSLLPDSNSAYKTIQLDLRVYIQYLISLIPVEQVNYLP